MYSISIFFFFILKEKLLLGTKRYLFYLFLSNGIQYGKKKSGYRGIKYLCRGAVLKLPRIPCPSPISALGVMWASEREEAGHDDKAKEEAEGTGG